MLNSDLPGGGFHADVVKTFKQVILSFAFAEFALAKCNGKRGRSELPGIMKSGGVQSICSPALFKLPIEGLPLEEPFNFFSLMSLEHTVFKNAKDAPS